MRDSEVVAAIAAGDSAGLAMAYDRYAAALFGYCRSLLREPADAEDVVHDTFVIAAVSLGRLRDPERLRPWLFAVARNLCLRKLRAGQAAAVYTAQEPSEDSDIGGDTERAELRALLRAAIGGLNAREREIIELQLWQGLDIAEAAAALDISRSHTHALLSRARDQLTASIGVLLVARTGREDCSVLGGMLGEWDGQLTVLWRKRLSRHIERCEICSDRRHRELRPALLTPWPAGALATAAAAEQAAHASGLPTGLKEHVLQAAAGKDAGAATSGVGLGSKAGTFGKSGFPRPLTAHQPLQLGGKHTRVVVTWGLAGAAAAVIGIVIFGGRHHVVYSFGPPGGGAGSAPGPSVSSTPSIPPSAGGVPPVSPGSHPAPGEGRRTGTGGGNGGAGGSGPVPVVTLTPVARSSSGVPPTSVVPTTSPSSVAPRTSPSSVAPRTPPSGQASSPPPSSSPPTSPQPSPQPSSSSSSAAPPPAPGTLVVSPTSVVLTPLLGSSLTLAAENGPVSWSISEPASLLGQLVVSPASGTLAAGQNVRVTISVSGLASLDTALTVNPGDQRVTVLLGVGLLGVSLLAGSG